MEIVGKLSDKTFILGKSAIYKNFTISLENWAFIIKWDNMTG